MVVSMRSPLAREDVSIWPATEDRFTDACAAVSPGCWCMLPRFGPKDTPDGREAKFKELLAGDVPPGLIAYVDGEVAGWLGFGPLELLPAVKNSQRLTQVDLAPAWTVVCFRIRRKHQGRGLARLLLQAAVDYVRKAGAPIIQAYPADTSDGRMNSTAAYVGTTTLFESEGFERITKTVATAANHPRWLMRFRLD